MDVGWTGSGGCGALYSLDKTNWVYALNTPMCGYGFVRPCEAMEIVSYSTKRGRMSLKLGIGQIRLHRQIKSDEIDIQDHRYRMSLPEIILTQVKMYHRYYVRGFAWAWMALRVRNPSPGGIATLNPQSTCHGPRPGPKLACGVRAGSLRATEPRARGKTRGRKRKKCRTAKKTHLYICTRFPFGMCAT